MAKHNRSAAAIVVGLVLLAMAGAGLVPAHADDDLLCELTGTCPDPGVDPDPAPVPTARRMVFTRTVAGQTDLALLDTATGEVSPINGLNSSAVDRDPAVSPDGRLIAFASNRAGDYDLYVAELAQPASTLRRVTASKGDENDPAWSPQPGAQRLAYTSWPSRGRDPRHVRIADLGAGTDVALDITRYSFSPAWSPTGDRIAVAGGTPTGIEILVYSPGSGEPPLQLTTGDTTAKTKSPDWSPDGRWIVFSTYREEFTKGRLVTSDWALAATRPADSDGDGRGDDLHTVHAGSGSYVDQADWHPDGKTLAFSTGNIMRMAVAEGQDRLVAGASEQLTDGTADYQPEWRRD